jgi:hypothetical protein
MPPGDDNDDDDWEEDDFGDFSSPAVEKEPSPEGANGEAAAAEDHLFGEDFATSDDGGESQEEDLLEGTGDAVHLDDLGGLNEATDAPPVDTVAVEDESFGEFDEAQPIQTPAPTAAVEVESVTEEGVTEEDDFGEFDQTQAIQTPEPTAAVEVESVTEEGVTEGDDFGEFDQTQATQTSGPTAAVEVESVTEEGVTEGDDFGEFDQTQATQTSGPTAAVEVESVTEEDDFGEFDQTQAIQTPPLGTPTLSGEVDDDDFGDFGVAEQPPAPSVGVALTDNTGDEGDFGEFGETELGPPPPVKAPTAVVEDGEEFGDFGGAELVLSSPGETPVMAVEDNDDFGEAEVAPLPPTETPSPVVENDDDFGDFGEAEQLPASPLGAVPAGSANDVAEDDEEDDFGDFGGAEGVASPEETAAAAIDDDDDFGDFGEAPAAIATTPPPTPSPLASSDPVFAPVAAAMYRMFQPSSVDDSAESEDVATVEQAEVLSISDVMVRRTMLYLRPSYIICSPFSSGIHAIRNARLGERRRADFHLGFAPKERFASERRITKECCWKASIPYIIPVTWLYKLAPAKEACRGPAGCGPGRIGCQIGGEGSRSHRASGNRKHCGANAASYQQ